MSLKVVRMNIKKQVSNKNIMADFLGKELSERDNIYIVSFGFDTEYYANKYPDIIKNALDPIEHYCVFGWKEGRNPTPWFSTRKYLERHTDVKDANINPFAHYLLYGQIESRETQEPESSSSGAEPISPSDRENDVPRTQTAIEIDTIRPFFDEAFYKLNYPDMRSEQANPIEHYCVFGWKEGRNPCDWFSTSLYIKANRDVSANSLNPFCHYIVNGRAEGRAIWPANQIGPRTLLQDPDATFVTDEALQDLIRFRPHPVFRFNSVVRLKCLDLNWVIPDFAVGSGGHMTIFRMIHWLERFGHKCTIWITDLTLHDTLEEAYDDIVKSFQTLKSEIRIADKSLNSVSGILFATGWQSVAKVVSVQSCIERFYFIQDYEPSFYSSGSYYLCAKWTYEQDLACICASPWLSSIMRDKFGRWATDFPLAYDPTFYYVNKTDSERNEEVAVPTLAVYSRITTPRRCVDLALLALEHLYDQGLKFVVHLFGSDINAAAARFPCVSHGILDATELGELYRNSTIGICFSATNYSLVPQEMMACGLPVVEIDTESTRGIFPDGVVTFSGPHPLKMAQDIRALMVDPTARSRQCASATAWINDLSWEASARLVEKSVVDRMIYLEGLTSTIQTVDSDIIKPYSIKASVCVPTYNGGDLLIEVIKKVLLQKTGWPFEIIIVDSSSSDGSMSRIPTDSRIKMTVIDKKEFQHGRTRNVCAQLASGEFIAFLTQDAMPADESWLYNLVTTLEHFPDAAGAFGRHQAWSDSSAFTKRDIAEHFSGMSQFSVALSKSSDPIKWDSGGQGWRQVLHYYSDNNSCMRRAVWALYPYPEIEYGEDQVWANTVVNAGFARVYAPGALVFHSHDYTPAETQERAETESLFFAKEFGYRVFDLETDIELQEMRKNDSDEQWARAHAVTPAELTERMLQNRAQLIGLRDGLIKAIELGIIP